MPLGDLIFVLNHGELHKPEEVDGLKFPSNEEPPFPLEPGKEAFFFVRPTSSPPPFAPSSRNVFAPLQT